VSGTRPGTPPGAPSGTPGPGGAGHEPPLGAGHEPAGGGRGPGGVPVRRVVVTGIGMLTALGADAASTWAGLVAGRSGIRPITSFDPSRVASRIAGEVPDFDPSLVLDRKEQRRNDRYTQLGLVATREAMASAGLPERLEGELALRTGIVLGTGIGGGITFSEQIGVAALKGPDRVSPFFIPMTIPNLAAGQASITFGALGPNFAVSSACATGGHAIGESWEIIRRGDADVMLAGSTEAGVHEPLVAGFAAMRALSTRNDDPAGASRPFDRGRDGFVVGEGAGVLVLEELEHARARGATPLAELVGYGATADANHITLPAPGGVGAIRAIRRALEKAGLGVEDVEHVNAHATSTPEGDRTELEMIRGLFGERAGEVSVTANKSMIGHTLGAAGSIEAAATVLSLRDGVIPPTINLHDPDPIAEGLDLTPNVARRRPIRVAVSNSFGFGGQNSALVFLRWDE
jgi:3-oxoacyl-[acyl-carrier-protein] synthase II